MEGQEKIIRVEVKTTSGRPLIATEKGFSFPEKIIDDRLVDNLLMIKGKNMPELAKGSLVNVITYHKSGDRVQYLSQVSMSSDTQFNAFLKLDHARRLEERRRFYKLKATESCRLKSVTNAKGYMEYDKPREAMIMDINIGGVFLVESSAELEVDDMITLSCQIMDRRIELQAKVLRQQLDENGALKGYGCCFINVTPKQEDVIAQYIYNIQLKQRKEQMDKDLIAEERIGKK